MDWLELCELVLGGLGMISWLAALLIYAKATQFLKKAELASGLAGIRCSSYRALSALLLPVSLLVLTNVDGRGWALQHCTLTLVLSQTVFVSFLSWSCCGMLVIQGVITNPFRAYGVAVKVQLVALTLLWQAGTLVLTLMAEGLGINKSDICNMNTRVQCITPVLMADAIALVTIVAWAWISLRTLLLTRSIPHTVGGAESGAIGLYCWLNLAEAVTMLASMLIKLTGPCVLPALEKETVWEDLVKVNVLAIFVVLLTSSVATLLTPDPRNPKQAIVCAYFDYDWHGNFRGSGSPDFSWLDVRLRQESLECITRGIVETIDHTDNLTELPDRSNSQSLVTLSSFSSRQSSLLLAEDSGAHRTSQRAWKGQLSQFGGVFSFIDYAAEEFAMLRTAFKVDSAEYALSIQQTYARNGLEMQVSNSRSGSFFYFTHDAKYMVKSMAPGELRLLQSILPDYLDYVRANPHTMLPQFYGCHALRYGPRGEPAHFLVMANVNSTLRGLDLAELEQCSYDLKGSWINRSAKGCGTLKDADWAEPLRVDKRALDELMAQLEADSQWLSAHRIMDYSLLLTLVQSRAVASTRTACVMHPCCNRGPDPIGAAAAHIEHGGVLVCAGLIDVLQQYDLAKRAELLMKSVTRCSEWRGLSCIPPRPYQQRFMASLRTSIFLPRSVTAL